MEHTSEISVQVSLEEHLTPASNVYVDEQCMFTVTSSMEERERSSSIWKLSYGLIMCLIFMAIEVVCGFQAHSLALFADALHMFTDVFAYAISLFSIWASGWAPTPRFSYGFLRIEILGTLASILSTLVLTVILVYEAIEKLLHLHATSEVRGRLMFGVASFGLVVNVFMMLILGHSHGHDHLHQEHDHGTSNINVRSAFCHVVGDFIQSIGVMIGAGVMWYNPNLKIIDPICTLFFSLLVVYTTINTTRDIFLVLMESTPRDIDATSLKRGVREIDQVVGIHELHIWAITIGKVALTCHIRIRREADSDMVLDKVVDYIMREYNISHVTIHPHRV